MQTTVTERGQTAIPARIRKRFGFKAHQKLEWMEDGRVITILPVQRDPIAAFQEPKKGSSLSEALLKSRRDDARRR